MGQIVDFNSRDSGSPYHSIGAYRAWYLNTAHDFPADMVWMCAPAKKTSYRHRILPLGEPSIAVSRRRGACGGLIDARMIICGPHEHACWHQSNDANDLIAVRVKPELAAQMLAIEPAEFKNMEVTAAPASVLQFFPATHAVMMDEQPHVVAQAMLADMANIAHRKDISLRIEHAVAAALRLSRGIPKVHEIAAQYSISERHLRRRFHDSVGCSPKDYARRLRVANAAILADAVEQPNWASIAFETGFHDQAHMITAFKALSGLTPGALHRERMTGAG